jgi:hypothetical protein
MSRRLTKLHAALGMTHQGWDVQLTADAARDWRANFFPVGIAHSIVGGTAWGQS